MPKIRTHLSNFAPQRSGVHFDDPDLNAAFRQMQDQIEALNSKLAGVVGPGFRPTGPTDVQAQARHGSITLYFRPDVADVSVRSYRVWRAAAGTTAAPTTPSAADALQIGTVLSTWEKRSPFEVYSFVDVDFTDGELTAPEARFMYWVSTLDIQGRESYKVPLGSGPVPVVAAAGGASIHHTTHENGGADEISVAGLSGLLADPQTPLGHHASHEDGGADEVSVAGLSGLLATAQTPIAHKTSHQDAGSDEISVVGLSGLLADPQTPLAHKTSHQDGGADEISVTGLAGLLATAQTPIAHKTTHEDGGADEISVTGLSGLLATAQTPAAHKTSHEDGGSDEISVTGLAGLLATAQTPIAHHANHEFGGSDKIKLDDLDTPDDNTDLNSSTSAHGLLKKLPNDATKFMDGTGAWTSPSGSGGSSATAQDFIDAAWGKKFFSDNSVLPATKQFEFYSAIASQTTVSGTFTAVAGGAKAITTFPIVTYWDLGAAKSEILIVINGLMVNGGTSWGIGFCSAAPVLATYDPVGYYFFMSPNVPDYHINRVTAAGAPGTFSANIAASTLLTPSGSSPFVQTRVAFYYNDTTNVLKGYVRYPGGGWIEVMSATDTNLTTLRYVVLRYNNAGTGWLICPLVIYSN